MSKEKEFRMKFRFGFRDAVIRKKDPFTSIRKMFNNTPFVLGEDPNKMDHMLKKEQAKLE